MYHRRLWNCIRFCNNRNHEKWDSHESFYQEFCDEKDFQLFSWEHLWHSTVDAKVEGKAIKNAKFIQAYGFKIEQISKHCNRLCWTQWNQFRWLYHCFEWADWVKLHQIETRPTKNQWQLEKRCWCQKTRKRLDKSKNIIKWMEKVGGHGDEWEPLDMCCCIPLFCVSTRKFMFACVCVWSVVRSRFYSNKCISNKRPKSSLSFDLQASQLFIAISERILLIVVWFSQRCIKWYNLNCFRRMTEEEKRFRFIAMSSQAMAHVSLEPYLSKSDKTAWPFIVQ